MVPVVPPRWRHRQHWRGAGCPTGAASPLLHFSTSPLLHFSTWTTRTDVVEMVSARRWREVSILSASRGKFTFRLPISTAASIGRSTRPLLRKTSWAKTNIDGNNQISSLVNGIGLIGLGG
jgi:hypothetical protein